jgi:hypothetical protein
VRDGLGVELVADGGKYREAVEEVKTVRATPGYVQMEIDLGPCGLG